MSKIPLILALSLLTALVHAEPIVITEQPEGFQFSEGKTPVLFYQRQVKSLNGKAPRANYVHPLHDLDGRVITEDFPADHAHHRGIFWTWHQLRVAGKAIGDPWEAKDTVWDIKQGEILPEGALRVTVEWKSPQFAGEDGKQKPIVRETTTIRAYPAEGDTRKIDFEIRLLAVEKDVSIGGSEDAKGYSGFSPRFKLPPDARFRGDYGLVTPTSPPVAASPFMDMVGAYEGGKPSGVAMLCHPSNPGYPQPWIIRAAKSMQNAVYPGREAVPLSTSTPTVLKYRLVLHRGEPDIPALTQWQAAYAATP